MPNEIKIAEGKINVCPVCSAKGRIYKMYRLLREEV
jgi:hypothetical protein